MCRCSFRENLLLRTTVEQPCELLTCATCDGGEPKVGEATGPRVHSIRMKRGEEQRSGGRWGVGVGGVSDSASVVDPANGASKTFRPTTVNRRPIELKKEAAQDGARSSSHPQCGRAPPAHSTSPRPPPTTLTPFSAFQRAFDMLGSSLSSRN